MAYSERSTINARFQSGEELPKVGDIREAQGLAHWKYRVLHIINVSQPDSARRRMVKMHVERWIVEDEEAK